MHLILYSGTPLDLKYPNAKGYLMFIKPENDSAKRYDPSSQINVNPSIHNLIRLDRNSYSQLPQPYSSCTVLDDNTLTVPMANQTMFDLTVQQGLAYTQQFCISVCLQEWVVKICNCNSISFDYTTSTKPLCDSLNGCHYTVSTDKSRLSDCKAQCPLECSKSIIGSDQYGLEVNKNLLLSLESVRNRLCSGHAQQHRSRSVYI